MRTSALWRCALGVALVALDFGANVSAESKIPFKNMRDALAALRDAKTPAEAEEIRTILRKVPITSHDDLMALYDEARGHEDALPLVAPDKVYEDQASHAADLDSTLREVSGPDFKDDIAALIEKEFQDTKKESRLPIPALTTRSHVKAAIRYQRINALLTAAGAGKNEKARESLWEFIQLSRDSNLGKGAINALGKIGDPADLDRLISMVKDDPRLLFPLGAFGSMLIPRVMQEVDNPSNPVEIKSRLAGYIEEVNSHDAVPVLRPLLQHSNGDVVRHAASALERALRPSDDSVVKEMLNSPKWNVRVCAIIAIGQQAWSEEYGQLLIDVLKRDPDPNNRALAAHYLGDHRVLAAETALKEALADRSGSVRTDANSALKKISPPRR